MTNFPFSPTGNTVTLSTTTTSSNALVATWIAGGGTLRVANMSTNIPSFVAFGPSSQTTSTTTGMPILPQTVELFTVSQLQTYIAGITGSSTATLYITPGQGGV